ncbi:hypothetical protein, partial [[Clostridium] scindens]|uniref:hypothetical protein n=1 Tax=Clostridium scindens (strain JCM 10418 / VPI 12708) TaxID=29347 RepID=UPI0034C5FF1E
NFFFACPDLKFLSKIFPGHAIMDLVEGEGEILCVYCKIELPKVANGNWRMLHLQIGESCKAFARSAQERCSA